MRRREFLYGATVVAGASLLPIQGWADESPLIYLSPVKSNGALSKCQAEVWYAQLGKAMFVVTAADAWRAQAIRTGLTRTQVWIGDVGMWNNAKGKYKALPSVMAKASLIDDAKQHAAALAAFGEKYPTEWGNWGPKFREGLADGSRVLIRYMPG